MDSVIQNTERILARSSVMANQTPAAQGIASSTPSLPPPSVTVAQVAPVPPPTLPKLTLSTFDGKGNWKMYWKGFSEIIDCRTDIGESTKLRYIESSLKGEAADLLSHLLQRGCDYKEVVNGLTSEYKETTDNSEI